MKKCFSSSCFIKPNICEQNFNESCTQSSSPFFFLNLKSTYLSSRRRRFLQKEKVFWELQQTNIWFKIFVAQFQVCFCVCAWRRSNRRQRGKVTERVIGVSELSTFVDWPRALLFAVCVCVCMSVVFVYMTDPIKLWGGGGGTVVQCRTLSARDKGAHSRGTKLHKSFIELLSERTMKPWQRELLCK